MTIKPRLRHGLIAALACALPCAWPSLGHAAPVVLNVPLLASSGQAANIQAASINFQLVGLENPGNTSGSIDYVQASAVDGWSVPGVGYQSTSARSPQSPYSTTSSYQATFLFSGADVANQQLWFGNSGSFLPPLSLVDQTTGATIALGAQTCATNCGKYPYYVQALGAYLNATDTYKLTMTGFGAVTLTAGVPEPATWQLMLLAPCLMVGLRRLNRRRLAVQA